MLGSPLVSVRNSPKGTSKGTTHASRALAMVVVGKHFAFLLIVV